MLRSLQVPVQRFGWFSSSNKIDLVYLTEIVSNKLINNNDVQNCIRFTHCEMTKGGDNLDMIMNMYGMKVLGSCLMCTFSVVTLLGCATNEDLKKYNSIAQGD